jgi:hypothetical protein
MFQNHYLLENLVAPGIESVECSAAISEYKNATPTHTELAVAITELKSVYNGQA